VSTSSIFREGFSGLRRAKLATLGAVITIVIALLFIGFFYIISTNTARVAAGMREKVEMEAFLSDPVSRQRRDEIEKRVLAIDGVDRVEFVSKDDAAKIFKEEFGEDINSVLDFNPLPASYRIFLKEEFRTVGSADSVQKAVETVDGIEKVVYRRDMLAFIERQSRTLNLVGLAIGLLIGLSAMFLVSNTIRLTIAVKRKAIQTMKLVGATRWFVRAPFIIEGVFQGVSGGVIAAAIIYYALTAATTLLSSDLAEFLQADAIFYCGLIGAGAILGFLGSVISVWRFIGETVGA